MKNGDARAGATSSRKGLEAVKKKRERKRKMGGLITTAVSYDGDGTVEMCLNHKRLFGSQSLRGFGHDPRSAAMMLARDLHFYADWLAIRYGFEPMLDENGTRVRAQQMTGREDIVNDDD